MKSVRKESWLEQQERTIDWKKLSTAYSDQIDAAHSVLNNLGVREYQDRTNYRLSLKYRIRLLSQMKAR